MKKLLLLVLSLLFSSVFANEKEIDYYNILDNATPANANEKLILLQKGVEENNFSAVYLLSRLYLGDISITPIKISGFNNIAKKMQVNQNHKKGLEILRNAAKKGDTDSMVLLAVLHIKGKKGCQKNLDIAREWLTQASKKNNTLAKICVAHYFTPKNIRFIKTCKLSESLITDETKLHFTFEPQKSADILYAKKEKIDDIECLVIDESKVRYDTSRQKLVPPICLQEFEGLLSDNGAGVYAVDPMQDDRFFSNGDLIIENDSIRFNPKDKSKESILYEQIYALPNGLRVISFTSLVSGSLQSCQNIWLLGFTEFATISPDDKKVVLLKFFGEIDSGYGRYCYHKKIETFGNTIAIYTISTDGNWENEKITNEVDIFSFETDKQKQQLEIKKIIKKLDSH